MSIEYYIDEKAGIIYEVFKGQVTVDDLIAHMERQGNDPIYKAGMPTIADLNQTSGDWSYLEIKRLQNYVKQKTPETGSPVKWAVVCEYGPANLVVKVFDLMSKAIGIPIKIEIFKTQEEALSWVREK